MSQIIDGFISKSILDKTKSRVAYFDWLSVPTEQQLLPDSILSWVTDFEDVSLAMIQDEEENMAGIENPTKRLKKELEAIVKKPLALQNRFESLTTSKQLATFSEGFVPANTANTAANSDWAVRNFKSWADW